jgi:hypothetical protein
MGYLPITRGLLLLRLTALALAPTPPRPFFWRALKNIKMLKVFRVDCVRMISVTRAAKRNHVLR